MKSLSLFTYAHIIPNLWDVFFFVEQQQQQKMYTSVLDPVGFHCLKVILNIKCLCSKEERKSDLQQLEGKYNNHKTFSF